MSHDSKNDGEEEDGLAPEFLGDSWHFPMLAGAFSATPHTSVRMRLPHPGRERSHKVCSFSTPGLLISTGPLLPEDRGPFAQF